MQINGWKYYNHAAIPTTAPHETPDTSPITDGSIWKISGSPLLARWTTEFDCGYETNWWYIIKDRPFDYESMPSKEKKSMRQALRKCCVKRINMMEYIDSLYDCYFSAVSAYKNSYYPVSKEKFEVNCKKMSNEFDCWACFGLENNILMGYMIVERYDDYCNISIAKFHPQYFKFQASDALYYTCLDFYLNEEKLSYVSSGERSISHITGTQEYKIRRFGYRKAYCKINIIYKPSVKLLVNLLYWFRGVLRIFDKINFVHKINGVLLMEKFRRERCRNDK